MAKLVERTLSQKLREQRIEDYEPYPKQRLFHDAGLIKRERLLRAGNQLGKCTTITSIIATPSGPRVMRDLLEANRPFEVLAWDGERPVRAFASAPFRKPGAHHCFRVRMADGQTIECADHHRVLTSRGWRLISQLLPAYGLGLLASKLAPVPSIHGVDGQSYVGIASDCPGDCCSDCHQCGAPLLWGAGTDQALLPSPADALTRSHLLCGADGHPLAAIDTHRDLGNGRRSIWGGPQGRAGRFVECEALSVCTLAQCWSCSPRACQPPDAASADHPQSICGFALDACRESQPAPRVVSYCAGNDIVAIEYIASAEVYDFEVHGWHNYLAAGLVHHNTWAGACEASYHLTGLYPPWWQGRRIEQPNAGWVGGPSGELVRDGPQRVLVGRPDEWGTGALPKRCIVDMTRASGVRELLDTITVRHVSGGLSRVKFKTYDQGRERWQAETLHWVWLDEEPDLELYTEALSRTNATSGFIWLTFTPLLGVSDVVMRFLKEQSDDRADIVMGIEDALHIPAEDRARIIASYPEHEREARVRGIPVLGSGRVFPFPRAVVATPSIPIPRHWARLGAIDIGWDHPTAAVKIAHDRDADIVYVTNAYRAREQTVAVHAGALVPWGAKLPWAWPHDAFQHDKGSGEQIAELYKRHGLNMLGEHAQFADDRGFGLEAGLFEMLDRIQTGRLKVFEHLNDWFEEFELYHRKDGIVVKLRDDLMSATRIGLMMLRYAKPLPAPYDAYARSDRRERKRGSAWTA